MAQVATEVPVVETQPGPVMGREKAGALLFSGIPYAASTTGDARFTRATPPEPWRDILDATRFGPAAPQIPSGGLTNSAPVRWDEDCLSLNICTPAADGGARPVLVWIHGGGYRSGQGAIPWYNGNSFAVNGDIVVVSINYRLGALGFTDLSRFGDDYATSGVNGLLDQITALEWVRDNIAAFGGDPKRVTIAGESAGGFSVCTLLGSPRAQGLFHRAIAQSGAAHHTLSESAGNRVADLLLEELQVSDMAGLQALSPKQILEAQDKVDARFAKESPGIQAFYPVEGNEVLPSPLLTHISEGMGKDVPLLTGVNKDEATLFIMQKVSEERTRTLAAGYAGSTEAGEALLERYRAMHPDADSTQLAIKLNTDFMFKVPFMRLVDTRTAQGAETYAYQFDWESRAPHLKATHALEIPFTFNTLNSAGVDIFIGEGEVPQHVADVMHQAWIDFINGGSPGWNAFDASRGVMHFNDECRMVEDGDAAVRAAWEGVR